MKTTSPVPSSVSTVAQSTSNMSASKDSILQRLSEECESLSGSIANVKKTYLKQPSKPDPVTPLVRKRGRPRKHFPPPDKTPLFSLSPADTSSPVTHNKTVIKKKRKRKVKGYPWGSIKKKRKFIQPDVSFYLLIPRQW